MDNVIQPYICYFVCNLYKQSLSYISSDCNEFHIKFSDYLDMQVYMEYKMSQIKTIFCRSSQGTGCDLSAQNVCKTKHDKF